MRVRVGTMTLTICKGVKKNGDACRFRAREDGYCRIHAPKESKECPICYEVIKGKDSKVTSCKHLFHRECLEKWTRDNSTCPMCRHIIAPVAPKRVKSVYMRPFTFTEDGRIYRYSWSIFDVVI